MAYKSTRSDKWGGTWSLVKQPFSLSMAIMTLFGTSGQVAVTVFIMISSWLMAERKMVKSKKIILLMMKTAIIAVGVYVFAIAVGFAPFSAKLFVKELITPFYTQYWFITCYCIYYFVVPLLNELFEKKSDRALKAACFVLILTVTVYHAIIGGPFGDIIWFAFIHIIVLYMRRVADTWSDRNVYGGTVAILVLWYIALFVDLLLLRQISEYIGDFLFNILVYRSLPVLAVSVSLFEAGRRLNHSFSAAWSRLAGYTLPIYIVHENFIWYYGLNGSSLWNGIFKIEYFCGNWNFLIWLPLVIGVVFISGMLASKIADLIIRPFERVLTDVSAWCDRTFGGIYEDW